MGTRGWIASAAIAVAAVVPASAGAATFDATANGNPFTGGLSFEPREIDVALGDTVRWTNTDDFVPHTVTEDHGLFDLSGDYGIPGAMGFGPGESVELRFAAGSYGYFCDIHPEMVGQVQAPVELKRKGTKRKPRVLARWGAEELPADQVFDVQRSVDGGGFKTVVDGTRELSRKFKAKRGKEVAFQARVRLEADPEAASGYSPASELEVR